MLKLYFLGRPRVILSDTLVDNFASTKELLLLAYLAMNPGRHSRQRLAGLLWGEMPEKRAKANLRTALYNLKQQLPGYFESTRKSIAFNREQPYFLDVAAFQAKLEGAEAAPDSERLRTALTFYRGDFLEGLHAEGSAASQAWIRGQREQLRLKLLTVLKKLTDREAAAGNWETAIDVTRQLLSLEPWRETYHRQLMRLLAQTGQYGAALAQYKTCRQILAAELGVDPMPKTVALYERIRRLRNRPRRHNLPPQPTAFVNREAELQLLHEMLSNPEQRLITLTGPGGVGKTRLAVKAAALERHAFLDGVSFIPLANVNGTEALVPTLAAALKLPLPGQVDPRHYLLERLQRREQLLVLDNFEHLLDGAELLTEILEQAPAVKLLVTSRERLNLRWEFLLPVQGVPVSGGEQGKGVGRSAAGQLFRQSARRLQPSFRLSGTNRPAVVRICRLTEGLPLALELAAARVPNESCAAIADALESNLSLLATSAKDAPDRHRSVRAAFEYSWVLLSETEQQVYKKLAVFRGSFDEAAARQIAGASPRLLAGLVDKTLLQRATANRYTMHELLRQYARIKLAESPAEETAVRQSHASYYTRFVKQREDQLRGARGQPEALAEVEAEFDNLKAAWRWAITNRDHVAVNDAIWGLWVWIESRGQAAIIRPLFEEAIEVWEAGDDGTPKSQTVLAKLWLGQAWCLYRLGVPVRSLQLARQSLSVLQQFGTSMDLATVHLFLGAGLAAQGDVETAREHVSSARELYQELDDRWGMEGTTFFLGEIAWMTGDVVKARQRYKETLAICQSVDHITGNIFCLRRLGDVATVRGELEEAERFYQRGLALAEEMDNARQRGMLLFKRGRIARELGNDQAARRFLQQGMEVAVESQNPVVMLDGLMEISELAHSNGNVREACDLLAFVRYHPACHPETLQRAEMLFNEVTSALPDNVVAKAEERARMQVLDDVVAGTWKLLGGEDSR